MSETSVLDFKIGQTVEIQQAWKDTGSIITVSPTAIEVKWITINGRDAEGFTTWIEKDNFDLGYKLLTYLPEGNK